MATASAVLVVVGVLARFGDVLSILVTPAQAGPSVAPTSPRKCKAGTGPRPAPG